MHGDPCTKKERYEVFHFLVSVSCLKFFGGELSHPSIAGILQKYHSTSLAVVAPGQSPTRGQ